MNDDVNEELLSVDSNIDNEVDYKKIESQLGVVSEIPLEVTCILGQSRMTINQVLKLAKGSVIELDKSVGESIDLMVNGRLIAKGEVVIVEDKIGITITEIIKTTSI